MRRLSAGIILILFSSLFQVMGDTLLDKAIKLEEGNKKDEAASIYREWLTKNTEDKEFFTIFMHYTLLEKDPEKILSFIVPVIPKMQKREERRDVYAVCALLQELRGNIEQAIIYYIEASNNSDEEKKRLFLLSAAELIFEQGDFDRTLKLLSSLINDKEKTEIQARVALLYARSLTASGKTEEAEHCYLSIMEQFKETTGYPGILLGYYEHLYYSGKNEEARRVYEILKTSCNTCPEYFCAQQLIEDTSTRIESYPGPSSYFISGTLAHTKSDEKETENTLIDTTETPDRELYIQTGSYILLNNAQDMVKELNTHSFTACIMEKKIGNTLYYRVVIKVKEDETANDVILRLKEAGYEGFLISL